MYLVDPWDGTAASLTDINAIPPNVLAAMKRLAEEGMAANSEDDLVRWVAGNLPAYGCKYIKDSDFEFLCDPEWKTWKGSDRAKRATELGLLTEPRMRPREEFKEGEKRDTNRYRWVKDMTIRHTDPPAFHTPGEEWAKVFSKGRLDTIDSPTPR